MKLKTRIFLSFFLIIFVPAVLILIYFFGVSLFQAGRVEELYGIDLANITPSIKALSTDLLFALLVVLLITAFILSIWISSGISSPIYHLTDATRSIRDGNLDFELKEEGVVEIRELCRDFEAMRRQLKLANEEKLEADRQNRELISNISHDLKTPITAVKGYVEGIMDGVADTPEKMDRYIKTIYNKAIEMDRLINELTFYSKINTNRIPYNFERISVVGFFGDAAEELEDELSAKNIEFSYENTVSADVRIIADAEQLRRVINNIIGNSVKYMDKEEKKISMSVRDAGAEVEIAITDNGKGIAAKDIGNIFDRFYRADSSRNSSQGGSGIGLSIVHKVIEDHSGRVFAQSKEGEGTTMTICLRKYEETASEPVSANANETPKRSRHKSK